MAIKNVRQDKACPYCGRYDNRGLTIDAVIVKDGNVLLIQRGVEPFKGYWATPGGYVRWGETVEAAVRSEVVEETGLEATSLKLVGVYSDPKRHPKQAVNMVYLVEVSDGEPKAGDDADDARWFSLADLPEQLALDHKQNIADALKLLK